MTDLAVLQSGLADDLARIASVAVTERIAPDVLMNAVTRVLRRAHIQAALAGRQAVVQGPIQGVISRVLDFFDPLRGNLSNRLIGELGYMANFIAEIRSGKLSAAQIEARFQLYAQHLQATYWGAQTDVQKSTGLTEEMRVLNPGESCPDCVGMAGRWVPIGTLPEPGENSVCRANCHCTKVYR